MGAGKSEQGLKRSHGCTPTVEPEDELVEVRRKMLGLDAMVGPAKPGFEVAEGLVNAGQG